MIIPRATQPLELKGIINPLKLSGNYMHHLL
jgi:hypothetical protein